MDGILESEGRLAIASCYPRDVDRLTTLYRAAREADRDLVISAKTAYLLHTMGSLLPEGAPVPGRSEGLRVYRRTKKVYYKWEREFVDDGVDAEHVRREGRRLLLQLDLPHFAELIDIRPETGSPYIHSMSEPFSEDDVDDQVLHNWLDHFGMGFHQFHASGHCSGPELHEVGERMRPGMILPIHTEHPEAFRSERSRIVSPEKGIPIELGR